VVLKSVDFNRLGPEKSPLKLPQCFDSLKAMRDILGGLWETEHDNDNLNDNKNGIDDSSKVWLQARRSLELNRVKRVSKLGSKD
jgi:hypothetical protein